MQSRLLSTTDSILRFLDRNVDLHRCSVSFHCSITGYRIFEIRDRRLEGNPVVFHHQWDGGKPTRLCLPLNVLRNNNQKSEVPGCRCPVDVWG